MMFLTKIRNKILLEIKCYMADNSAERRLSCSSCFEMYPPSFYIRYTPDEQKEIYERDKKKIRELLDEE